MPKTKISEFSATPGNNTDIDGINLAEGCAPSGINDAIRELMAQLKDFQAGTAGDSFNGPIGSVTPAAGAFTTLSASGTTTLSGLTASTALALDASKNVTSITNTGAGNNVLATSPTLVTPNLGTPSAVTLTNATGLPISTGVSGMAAGAATFLATPSSANLASLVTDETGTGALVFAGSPTFTGTVSGAALTLSGALTLNGGTANGVAYLNGSKVLTTGSALSFDGSNLLSLGQGGTGTTSALLILNGSSATDYGSSIIGRRNGAGSWFIGDAGTALGGGALGTIFYNYGGTSPWHWHLQDAGEQMRLTSTGLGIGTSSPAAKLDVAGPFNGTQAVFGNTSGRGLLIGTALNGGVNEGSTVLNARGAGNGQFLFQTDGTTRLTLSDAGNLGLGGASFGGGAVVMFLANATTVPASNPSGGGVLYVEGGALKYRGSSGTVTTIAAA